MDDAARKVSFPPERRVKTSVAVGGHRASACDLTPADTVAADLHVVFPGLTLEPPSKSVAELDDLVTSVVDVCAWRAKSARTRFGFNKSHCSPGGEEVIELSRLLGTHRREGLGREWLAVKEVRNVDGRARQAMNDVGPLDCL